MIRSILKSVFFRLNNTLKGISCCFISQTFLTINVIYIDETWFNLHIRRSYGRSRWGKRVQLIVSNSRGRNISICAAMSRSGIIHDVFEPYNTEKFIVFLQEMCRNIADGVPKTFMMDKVRFHHSSEVSAFLQTRGHNIIFLPAYPPSQLNSIKFLFSKRKSIAKRSLKFSTIRNYWRFKEVHQKKSPKVTVRYG
ncbi:hypothetical protein RF11_06196 [Thelohanellus kitauei]|uniref:Tc1-like transposase DDE domain-containing protein n=1 Tax=Thelohanellus kitauei TaxID=669202 RepID=A0A0C2M9K7_THEKT|nr:hypothetical protein RF11_06196 [Thelohanellus kitauei]